ncbi:hypothetical protein BTO06_05395 [Tenacibaculum sp. SZ-18]|uniref:GNAT family N-acetyltransferase n=1 Tax=Tenacibaculum sp. SZ-18 TaxID=754423 RepID=UPI000C2D1443|nr:GNAT family N-acetyltransferase [Tenacibaculum sp. SZ-18]AUC14605.1 hypothetical protein BTO06_05395 [Tenacibaculum sp. SZ-18]
METITKDIRLATSKDTSLLALLGRITFRESHGGYIEDKTNLDAYLDRAFSFETTAKELSDDNNIYFIIYKNNFPVGYAKLVKNATSEFIYNHNICRLERIYVLEEFISQKFGIDLLNKTVDKAKELDFDIIWLSVYIKNIKAIKFYQKNNFETVGSISFQIGKKGYENPILAKKL